MNGYVEQTKVVQNNAENEFDVNEVEDQVFVSSRGEPVQFWLDNKTEKEWKATMNNSLPKGNGFSLS